MLDENKVKAIELILENKLTKIEVAKAVKKSRTWLYDSVINDEECMAEMDKRLQQIQTFGIMVIKSSLQQSIDNIIELSKTGESEKIRLDASTYLIDRVYGKTTTKLEVSAEPVEPVISKGDIEEEFIKFKVE